MFVGYDRKQGLGNIQKYNKCGELNTKHYLLNDFISIIERKGYNYITRMDGISKA